MPAQISVTLPDGSSREVAAGATVADVAAAIGPKLAKAAVAGSVDGQMVDLGRRVEDGEEVAIVTGDSEAGRHVLRHSTAHVLAQAVTSLWPGAKYAIGPAIENGFYYDFELPGGARFTDEDLRRIEERMREIVREDQPFRREEHTIDEARSLFAEQPYKLEIIDRIAQGATDAEESAEGGTGAGVSAYRNTPEFVDMCTGPHVPSTGRLGHFALQRVAGAYWRGDEHRQQLQRIYGTAWESEKALQAHLTMLEEAEKRDHRRLGAELDLFSIPAELGGGLVLWHPKGARVRRLIEDFARDEHDANGYQLAFTPHLAKSVLWETSG
ncbi:MAG TPA: threonine--tRNA ligase, partial [Acidimicrobiales bacterium]|nr:threonine--tRNA ligase [Acidimicrobiales bacterium]